VVVVRQAGVGSRRHGLSIGFGEKCQAPAQVDKISWSSASIQSGAARAVRW
jgi:hypothetical protein